MNFYILFCEVPLISVYHCSVFLYDFSSSVSFLFPLFVISTRTSFASVPKPVLSDHFALPEYFFQFFKLFTIDLMYFFFLPVIISAVTAHECQHISWSAGIHDISAGRWMPTFPGRSLTVSHPRLHTAAGSCVSTPHAFR